jgi:N-acyl-D-aspartate/D-glutamate deacylase
MGTMMRISVFVLLCVSFLFACTTPEPAFDVVLQGGRVIDPETALDAVMNVGIRGDRIAAVSAAPLAGTRVIDATGLVVAPGFIDLHRHLHSLDGYRAMALDGVTTALELEGGVPDIRRFLAAREGKSPIHFGAAAGYSAARVLAWGLPLLPSLNGPEAATPQPAAGPVTREPASEARQQQILARLRAEIEAGALGIGMGLEYTPGATRLEVIQVFRLAEEKRTPVFVHARSAGRMEPGSSIESVSELIGASAITGASVHIVHVNSICLRDSLECLALIEGARARGLDITTETYPYTAGMTTLNSALFGPGWRERRGLDYADLELPLTGERLTRERFDALHASPEPRLVLVHMNPEEVVSSLVGHPDVMIASDGLSGHPRAFGTFSRVLGRYVRSQRALSLPDAIKKMSYLPALRLQSVTASAQRLGRLQQGAQADIVVFDAGTIEDRATFADPSATSVGVRYLLVAGTLVVDEGRAVDAATPGRAVVRDTTRS